MKTGKIANIYGKYQRKLSESAEPFNFGQYFDRSKFISKKLKKEQERKKNEKKEL